MTEPLPSSGGNSQGARALAALQAEIARRKYLVDPNSWVRDVLHEHLWSKQLEIFESVRDNRKTAVPSCHSSGKSFLAARIICWWISVHPPGEARVVTTATTWKQVETVLWHEIRRAHAKGKLIGRMNRTEWITSIPGSDGEEIIAFGHRPSETDPAAFHGIHSPYVLVVFDEAGGLPKIFWDSADSLISNEQSRFLAIGNPDDPLAEFKKVCDPGSGWKVIPISAFDTPNFTGEPIPDDVKGQLVSKVWVDEKERGWGKTNPLYIAKVLGQFPEFSNDGLIPAHWVRAAQERHVPKSQPCEMGVDVGGGGDKNVIAVRWGGHVRVVKEDRQPDTMITAGNIKRAIVEYCPSLVKIDSIGIGRGASDRLQEQRQPVIGIQVGERASDPKAFLNQRAEFYWHLRTMFQNEQIDIDPADEDLAAQLLDLRYQTTSNGRIMIESKDEARRRNEGRSPDRADAVMLACAPPPKKHKKATWGRRKDAA